METGRCAPHHASRATRRHAPLRAARPSTLRVPLGATRHFALRAQGEERECVHLLSPVTVTSSALPHASRAAGRYALRGGRRENVFIFSTRRDRGIARWGGGRRGLFVFCASKSQLLIGKRRGRERMCSYFAHIYPQKLMRKWAIVTHFHPQKFLPSLR